MSNNVPENDLVWLNNVSVHDELDFGGNGHKTQKAKKALWSFTPEQS